MKYQLFMLAALGVSAPVLASDAGAGLGREGLIPILEQGPWFYEVGGAEYVRFPKVDREKIRLSAGLKWNGNLMCDNIDPNVSFNAFMNGAKQGWINMQRNAVGAVKGTVASLPGLAVQHIDPGLYEAISTGFIQAQDLLQVEMKNCRQITAELMKEKPNYQWVQVSGYEKYRDYFNSGSEPKSDIQDDVGNMVSESESNAGKSGIEWLCGTKAGGDGQKAIKATDVVIGAYNKLLDRDNCDVSKIDVEQVDSVPSYVHYWQSPEELKNWFNSVLGETEIYTTPNKTPLVKEVGVGLMSRVEVTQKDVSAKLLELVNSDTTPTLKELREVSFTNSLVTTDVVNAIRNDVNPALWINRLALDVALEREVMRALEVRRLLLVGSDIEVVAGKEPSMAMVNQYIERLSKEISMVNEEKEIRTNLMSSSAPTLLQREAQRRVKASEVFEDMNTQLKGREE